MAEKINLTRLLEIPSRIREVGGIEECSASSFYGIDREHTSSDRAYSFVLEEPVA